MSIIGPNPPAGWYPDSTDPTNLRYWDGGAWTEHRSPRQPNAAPTPPPSPAPAPAPAAFADATQLSSTPSPVAPGTNWWSRLPNAGKGWIIAGGVIVLLLFFGTINNAINGGRDNVAEPVVTVEPADTVETVEPTPTVEPPAAEPAPAVVDVAVFRTQSNSHLDDMSKDLDDMFVTLDESGYWRLLSNSVELSFNLGQLQSIEAPPSVSAQYTQNLTGLETTIDSMSDPIANEDSAALRAIIDAMRAQIAATHDLVNSAT